MFVGILETMFAPRRPPLAPDDLRRTIRLYFGSTVPRIERLEATLAAFPPGSRRRLTRYVHRVHHAVDNLLLTGNSGCRSLERHLDWMEEELLRRFPELDRATIRTTRHYCEWTNWHG